MSARRAAAVVVAAAVVGVASGTAWAAFGSTTTNANSFSAKSDLRAPTVTATTAARADGGGTAGSIRQGAAYYVYANLSDTGSPASGVQTVTVDASSFDTGVTAAPLTTTGGPWTVGGTSYAYRTALLAADTPLTTGATYPYSLRTVDVAGNSLTTTDFTVTIETYLSTILGTSGLVSHWRLGEADPTVSSDTFTDTAGALLQNHTGELGATWTRHLSSTNAVISNEGRLRRNTTGATQYYTSGVPSSADYSVQASVHVKSVLNQDAVAVLGRLNAGGTSDTYYLARYVSSGTTKQWDLMKVVSGTATTLGSFAQTLTIGATYTLTLDLQGSTIRLLVDDVQRVSVNDTSIAAAGRGGLRVGFGGAADVPSNTTGLHLDNFVVRGNAPAATDGKGTNHGAYLNGVALGVAGALAGDPSTAAQFDGTNDHVAVTRQIQDDFSIELWFRSTQGLNTNSQWWGNAGLVDAEVSGAASDFGVSLRSDGRITAGVGTPDVSIVSSTAGLNDGAWHHVVFTRTRSSGALRLYVDGALVGSATGSTLSLTAPASINFGRIQTGTNHFAGTLDEVAVYNVALAAGSVTDHYNLGRGT